MPHLWLCEWLIQNLMSATVQFMKLLTHWGRVTHIYVPDLTIIGSDNGLSPGRRQAITWTNVGILLIGPLGTNFSEMLIKIHTFSFKKIHLKMLSGKWRPFCLGVNVSTYWVCAKGFTAIAMNVVHLCQTDRQTHTPYVPSWGLQYNIVKT